MNSAITALQAAIDALTSLSTTVANAAVSTASAAANQTTTQPLTQDQAIQNAHDQLVQLALDPLGLGKYSDVINPVTGLPYTFLEGQRIVDEALGQNSGAYDLLVEQALDQAYPLGSLSERFETSGGGPGTVANNPGDPGGASYGTYQMAANRGTPQAFLRSSYASAYANDFAGLVPGSPAFDAKWREVANRDPNGFGAAQHRFIQASHYDPAITTISNNLNYDITQRSRAVQNVVWSVAVQHGSGVPPIRNAFRGVDISKMTDAEIINAIYTERERKNANGDLVYFRSSSRNIQRGVANRFVHERAQSQQALIDENLLISGI